LVVGLPSTWWTFLTGDLSTDDAKKMNVKDCVHAGCLFPVVTEDLFMAFNTSRNIRSSNVGTRFANIFLQLSDMLAQWHSNTNPPLKMTKRN
jgi:hypothetical protein